MGLRLSHSTASYAQGTLQLLSSRYSVVGDSLRQWWGNSSATRPNKLHERYFKNLRNEIHSGTLVQHPNIRIVHVRTRQRYDTNFRSAVQQLIVSKLVEIKVEAKWQLLYLRTQVKLCDTPRTQGSGAILQIETLEQTNVHRCKTWLQHKQLQHVRNSYIHRLCSTRRSSTYTNI